MVWIAMLMALGCAVASALRLRLALVPTLLEPGRLVEALRGDAGKAKLAALAEAVARAPGAEWEQGLLEAVRGPREARTALINEQLLELDWRLERWARVPRACASIATSSGFLLAALFMRAALSDASALGEETRDAVVRGAVNGAVDIVALGIAGTAF